MSKKMSHKPAKLARQTGERGRKSRYNPGSNRKERRGTAPKPDK